MIVFPILNFVLPLMLTSFLLSGNFNECISCKNVNKFNNKTEIQEKSDKNLKKFNENDYLFLKNSFYLQNIRSKRIEN